MPAPAREPHHSVQELFAVRPETLPAAGAPWADTRTWSQRHPDLAAAAWGGAAVLVVLLALVARLLWRRWRQRI